jgi:hypothetical protein
MFLYKSDLLLHIIRQFEGVWCQQRVHGRGCGILQLDVLRFWILLVLTLVTECTSSGTGSNFVLGGGGQLSLSTAFCLRTENKSPKFCIHFERERQWVEARNAAMLIVLARSRTHCLAAIDYVRILCVVAKRYLYKLNNEECILIVFMDTWSLISLRT